MSKFKDDIIHEYVNEVQKFCCHKDETGPKLEPCNYPDDGYECYLRCKLCGAVFEVKSITPDELQRIKDRANELKEDIVQLTQQIKILANLYDFEIQSMVGIYNNLDRIDDLCDYYVKVLHHLVTSKPRKRTKKKRKDDNK